MSTEEKITVHLPNGVPERCRSIVVEVVQTHAREGSEAVTSALMAKTAAFEQEFDRNLAELQKLI